MIESIYKLKIFAGLESNIIDNIIDGCSTKVFHEDEMILLEWEESNWEWYILKEGHVAISIRWQHVAELSTGDIFGEIALLNEEERTATVTAIGEVEVIVLKIDNILEMISSGNTLINKTVMERIEENLERV